MTEPLSHRKSDLPMLNARCATCGKPGVFVVKGINYCGEHVAKAAGWPDGFLETPIDDETHA